MSVDTRSLARELRAANLALPQAEAIATAIGRAVTETAATKTDLAELRAATRSDIDLIKVELERTKIELRGEIRAASESVKSTLVMWFVGTQIALGAIIIAALKL